MFDFLQDADRDRPQAVQIINVTMWQDGPGQQRTHTGRLYPVTRTELTDGCDRSGLEVTTCLWAYDRSPYDPAKSQDLMLIAQRRS